MSKAAIIEAYGDELWEPVVLLERSIMGQLHHPLLINLAYAFQNIDYLWLVMDICDSGDLSKFGCEGEARLSKAQVMAADGHRWPPMVTDGR